MQTRVDMSGWVGQRARSSPTRATQNVTGPTDLLTWIRYRRYRHYGHYIMYLALLDGRNPSKSARPPPSFARFADQTKKGSG